MAVTESVRVSNKSKSKTKQQTDPAKIEAVMPQAAMYGIYGPQYAAALAAKTGATGADIMNKASLHALANRERSEYAEALASAQAAQEKLQREAAIYGIYGDVAERNLEYTDRGMGGSEQVVFDESGRPFTKVDPIMQQVGNADVLNTNQADRFGVYSAGTKNLADAGYGMTPEDVGKLVTPPTQAEPQQYGVYATPSDQTARYAADEGLTAEEQFRMAEINKAAKESGDDVEGALTIGANGVAQVVYKGSPEALAKYGIDPATGRPLNPNAGASGGAAPATPAAEEKKETPKKPTTSSLPGKNNFTVRPVSNGRAVFKQLFPDHEPTQVERDPNSALGKANPESWHNKTKAAIDSKPIAGMTFNEYVQRYKDAGYEIIEAKDEVKNPSRHATGPHWHVVIGKKFQPQVYASRLLQHPAVADQKQLDNGDILVTMKDGSQRVYRNGKRVGG